VSCPDWAGLAAHRSDRGRPEPPGWEAALAHLEACPPCRRRALAADPTLVFRRLAGDDPAAAPAAEFGAPDAADEMRRAVGAMRRAGRVLPGGGDRRVAAGVLGGWTDGGRRWRRIAATVAFAAGLLALASGPHRPGGAPAPDAAAPSLAAGSGPAAGAAGRVPGALALAAAPVPSAAPAALAPPAAGPAGLAVFEGLDRPRDAHVYQLDGEGMVVVMIVDETLDV
jgi:hypothetical protein